MPGYQALPARKARFVSGMRRLLNPTVVAAQFIANRDRALLVWVHHIHRLPLAFAVPGFDLVKLVGQLRTVLGTVDLRSLLHSPFPACLVRLGLLHLLIPRDIRDRFDAVNQRVVRAARRR